MNETSRCVGQREILVRLYLKIYSFRIVRLWQIIGGELGRYWLTDHFGI